VEGKASTAVAKGEDSSNVSEVKKRGREIDVDTQAKEQSTIDGNEVT